MVRSCRWSERPALCFRLLISQISAWDKKSFGSLVPHREDKEYQSGLIHQLPGTCAACKYELADNSLSACSVFPLPCAQTHIFKYCSSACTWCHSLDSWISKIKSFLHPRLDLLGCTQSFLT